MPDFLVSAKIVTRDGTTPIMVKAGRATEKFASKAETSFEKASRASNRFFRGFKGSLSQVQRGIGESSLIKGILGADIIREGFRLATREVGSFITEAANIQRAETQFGTLTRSAKEGVKVISELRALGAVTPFEFQDFRIASEILLAMRATTRDQLIPDLRMLGDTAGGSADKLKRIAFAYAETQANSKASFQEIRQFTNAGVPLLATLADMWRKNAGEAKKMVEQGRATGAEVRKAFKIMTSEGGQFFKGMERASKDFQGRMSTLRDEINITRANIGIQLIPVLTKYVDQGIEIAKMTSKWAEANQGLIREEVTLWMETAKDILRDLWPVAKGAFGVFREVLPIIRFLSPLLPIMAAGWLANKIALKGLIAVKIIKGIMGIRKAVLLAGGAQAFWNATLIANPIGVIITGVIIGLTAVAGLIFLIVKNWDSISRVAKNVFFGVLRIFTFTIGSMAKLAFKFAVGFGKLFGLKTVEREFTALVGLIDKIDIKMQQLAGQRGFAVDNSKELVKSQKIRLEGIQAIQLARKIANVSTDFKVKTKGLVAAGFGRSAERFGGLGAVRESLGKFQIGLQSEQQRKKDAAPFNLPAGFGGKTVVEHQIKLDITGAPTGSKIKVSAGDAPPVQVRLLGAN